MIILSIFCIYGILAIAEEVDSDENALWGSLFGKSLAQDWIVTPLLLLILTLALSNDNTTKIMVKKLNYLSLSSIMSHIN